MTTQADSKQYTESEYKRKYKSLKLDFDQLTIRHLKLKNEILKYQNKNRPKEQLTISAPIQRIKDIINEYFNVDIDVKIRNRSFVIGRCMYYHILRQSTPLGLKDMARTLTMCQDHSTVLHCLQSHSDWVEFDKRYKNDYEIILNQINNVETIESNND